MYLNVQRAALRLGVAPHTVRRWTASGLLPCVRTPGGHRRIRQEDVEALAQQIGGSNHLAARRARERELDTLLETSLALVSRLELAGLLQEIAERLTRLMDCHFCAISTFDEASRTVSMLADFDDGGRRLPDLEAYSLSRYPLTRRVLEEQVPAVVNRSDPAADPNELRELVREGDKSMLLVPLVYRERSIGLVELIDHVRERRYSPQELRICSAIAGQAAVALHNAQLFTAAGMATVDMEALCRQLDAIVDQVGSLDTATDVAGLLEATAQAACETFGGASCVASARGHSAGFAGRAPASPAGDAVRSERSGSETAVQGGQLVSVSHGSAGSEVSITLSLPRPTRNGEPQLLRVLAATAAMALERMA